MMTCVTATDRPHWGKTKNRKSMGSYTEKWRTEHVCTTHAMMLKVLLRKKRNSSILY